MREDAQHVYDALEEPEDDEDDYAEDAMEDAIRALVERRM
jgi:hypothetical protein